jgi:hypothetical protein
MINYKYLELLEPENLVEHIDNFEEWLNLAETKQDLIHTLKRFEQSEMYEYCAKIKTKMDNYDR